MSYNDFTKSIQKAEPSAIPDAEFRGQHQLLANNQQTGMIAQQRRFRVGYH